MRLVPSALVIVCALGAASALAQAHGVPSWAKAGVLHVELGAAYDSNGLPADYTNGKGHSAYPDGAVQNGYTLDLYAGTLIHTGSASSATGVYAWHNKPWSYAASQAGSTLPLPTPAPSSAINLVTKSKSPSDDGSNDTWIRYAFGTPGAYEPQRSLSVARPARPCAPAGCSCRGRTAPCPPHRQLERPASVSARSASPRADASPGRAPHRRRPCLQLELSENGSYVSLYVPRRAPAA